MLRKSRPDSLARRLLVSTVAMMAATVLLLASAGIIGVYATISDLEQERISSECAAVAVSLGSRFAGAADILEAIVRDISSAEQKLSSRQWVAGFEHFDTLVLVSSGKTVSAYPRGSTAQLPPEVLAQATTATTFVHVGHARIPEEGAVVWAVRRLGGDSSDVVAGRLRTRFVSDIVAGTSGGNRVVCVTCEHGPISFAGATREQVLGLRYDPDFAAAGSGAAEGVAQGSIVGRYLDLERIAGVTWRVAVLESRAGLLEQSRRALTPAAIAGIIVALLSVIGVSTASGLLVSPLHDLERRVQRAATGAYVRPIEISRTDEVGRLANAFNDLTTRLNALHDISRLLGSAARSEEVLDSILAAVGHIAPSATAAVFVTDMVSGDLVAERVLGRAPVRATERTRTDDEHSLAQAMRANGPVSIPPASAYGSRTGGESLAVPLRVGDEVFGLLLMWDDEQLLSDAEIETLGTFASQASIALRNSRLFEAECASRIEAEALREVAELLADPRDLASAMSSVREVAGVLLGADRSLVAVWDRHEFGLPPSEDPEREGLLLDVLASAGGGGSGGALVIEDVASRRIAEAYVSTGVKSLIIVPLIVREEPAGCIGFEYSGSGVWFGEARMGLANTIGKQLSLALANSYLFAQTRRRAANLETVFRISQAVGSSLETRVVLDRVLDVVQKIFSADAVSLMTYDPTKRLLVTPMARGMVSQEMLDLAVSPGTDVPGEVFDMRHPRMIGRLDSSADGVEAFASAVGLRSLAAVPLLARGRSIGVLSMFSKELHAYREEDIELLSTFGSQAALALDNARLYGREHNVASVLQSSIVPDTLPRIAGIDADSVYRPAGRDAEIGGDYYDMFPVADGRVVLAMCDVCGKGIHAATKTSMVKYSVRALAASGVSPAGILAEVNKIVSETGDSAEIVTLMVAVLDRSTGKLTYANGGHPPAMLLLPESRQPTWLPATGPLLGALAEAKFQDVVIDAPAGSTVVMYTDGVTEARRGNRFFGETRLRRALAAGGHAAAVTRRIISSLSRFTPGDLRDDVAILAVRIESEGERPRVAS